MFLSQKRDWIMLALRKVVNMPQGKYVLQWDHKFTLSMVEQTNKQRNEQEHINKT